MEDEMILVIGATAHFGRETVQELAARGEAVRALTRHPEKAALPDGVEVVRGDLTAPETLPPALAGVTTLVLVLPYQLDPAGLLAAAQEAGVRRVVFLSSGAIVDGADEQPDVIAAYHAGVEQAIVDAGFEWTFLRLFFPAINALSWGMQLDQGDVISAPYAGATSAPVHEADVAEAVAAVATGDGHAGQVYHLTSGESLTQADQVRTLGEALGRPLTFTEVDPGPVKQMLSGFMDAAFVDALFGLMEATVDKPAAISPAVEQLTGHAPRSFAEWATDHANDFGGR